MEKLLLLLESLTTPLLVIAIFLGLFFLLHLVLRWKYKEEHKKTLFSQLLFFALAIIAIVSLVIALPLDRVLQERVLGLLGILLSGAIALSATTLLGNALAGLMMRGVRNFRLGDFIDIDGNFGRVTERGLFHVEIQTADRNLVTLPNLVMVTNPLKVFQPSGTIITTKISLGYDVSHEKIKALLIEAARKTGLEDPFVYILELGDFSILYKVSGLLKQTEKVLSMRSRLNEEVMMALHNAAVEIVSPVFENQRNVTTQKFIPPKVTAAIPQKAALQPEKRVFDKAETAGELTQQVEKLASTEQLIAELREQAKTAQTDEEKTSLERKIANLEANRESTAAEIKSLNVKLDEDITPH